MRHGNGRKHRYSRARGLLDAAVSAQNGADGVEVGDRFSVFHRVEIVGCLHAEGHVGLLIEEVFRRPLRATFMCFNVEMQGRFGYCLIVRDESAAEE